MKKIVTAIIMFSFFSIALFANPVATIKSAEGDVKAVRGGESIALKKSDKLLQGDVIETAADSSAGIIFNDGTALSIGPKSLISIDSYVFEPTQQQYDFKLNMKKGLANFESGKIGKLAPEAVEFKIPDGVIGIRGTKFFVEVKE